MRITDLIEENSIELNVNVNSKSGAIDKIISLMDNTNKLIDKEQYKKVVLKREEAGTTGIGEEIAIPHGKSDAVKEAGLAAMVIPDGVDFESIDRQKVKLMFLIAAPNNKNNLHLDVLSRLSTLLMDKEFKEKLINAKTKEEFLNYIDQAETDRFKEEINKQEGYEILCVTSCPTGIAHTYMAAEGLEKAGKQAGYSVKVETQGQAGVKNRLTDEEIKNAKAIIIAADTKINLDRFDGKKLLKSRVSDGIHKPLELINEALSDKTEIFHSENNSKHENNQNNIKKEGIGRSIYKHLMNGVTHMLPFVVGGGILIAISFLLDNYEINPSGFGSNTPLAAFFNNIGNVAFNFMLTVLAGYIAMSIADRPGLAAGFVGGSIALSGITIASIRDASVVTVSSGFLGALLAGFIAGYIVIGLNKIFNFLPKSLEALKPILIFPVLGILITGFVIMLINPFIASINTGLNNFLTNMSGVNRVLLGIIVAGMMSVDLGGPVNKAAYTFGTGMLAEGHYDIMAAVMAGGMVAPIAIAILATFFPKKLPKSDRQSALLNYVMGLSFISEGAIPFASSDPIRVLPACIIGSAVSGALSMLFNCTLMAPHGGIFVIGIVGNSLMYMLSIAIGSIVAAIIMAIFKKNVKEGV